jgi:hypothetical protein
MVYDQAHGKRSECREFPGKSHEPATKIAGKTAGNYELERKSGGLGRYRRPFAYPQAYGEAHVPIISDYSLF